MLCAHPVRPMPAPIAGQVRGSYLKNTNEKNKQKEHKSENKPESLPSGTTQSTIWDSPGDRMNRPEVQNGAWTKWDNGATGWNKMGQRKKPIFLKRFQRNWMDWGNTLVQNGAVGFGRSSIVPFGVLKIIKKKLPVKQFSLRCKFFPQIHQPSPRNTGHTVPPCSCSH